MLYFSLIILEKKRKGSRQPSNMTKKQKNNCHNKENITEIIDLDDLDKDQHIEQRQKINNLEHDLLNIQKQRNNEIEREIALIEKRNRLLGLWNFILLYLVFFILFVH